jgi:large subunit ribosomal protein L25
VANISLTAQPRTVLGKKVARLRRSGITPANIYGHNVQSTPIQVDTHDLSLLVRRAGRTALITLSVEGERETRAVLIRDYKRRPTTGDLVHVDFMQVSMREKLTVTVPLQMTGHAPVLDTSDAVVFQSLESVQVECLPGDIPQHIEIDVSGLEDASQSVHVRDLAVPSGVTILNDPDIVVVSVTLKTAQAEVEAEEAAAAEAAAEEAAAAGEEVPAAGEEAEGEAAAEETPAEE